MTVIIGPSTDPVIRAIDKRLMEIEIEITRLHHLKIDHRAKDAIKVKPKEWTIRISHCYQCEMWTYEQKDLRLEKIGLIEKRRMILDAAETTTNN